MEERLYCGIDLHKNFSAVCLMDKEGTVFEERKLQHIGDIFKSYFRERDPMECVVEPVENWGWVVDYLAEAGHRVHLANTYKVRLIAESRVKTDRVDAKVLADLLRTGYLPEGYIAPIELRDQRAYLRYRIGLVRERSRLKNQVKRLLRVENVEEPSYKDTFGKKGWEWLEKVQLRPVNDRIKRERLEAIKYYNEHIERLDSEIKLKSRDSEVVRHLMTVPGIGQLTAHMIMAEVGDMSRFASAKHFAGYTGLVSSQRSSADKTHSGHITKQGNKHMRWLLVEAAQKAKTLDINLKLFFDRIAYKKGKGAAHVALARKLSEICWHIAVDNVPYDSSKVCRRVG